MAHAVGSAGAPVAAAKVAAAAATRLRLMAIVAVNLVDGRRCGCSVQLSCGRLRPRWQPLQLAADVV